MGEVVFLTYVLNIQGYIFRFIPETVSDLMINHFSDKMRADLLKKRGLKKIN